LADYRDQLFRRLAGNDIDISPHVGKNPRGVGVHLVRNKHFGLGHGKTFDWNF
jgi:hypothetical protein